MDINKINSARESMSSYLQNYIGEKEPVIVKKLKSNFSAEIHEILYVAIGLTLTELTETKTTKELPEEVLVNLLKRGIVKDRKQEISVIFIGNLNDYKKYESLIYMFPLRKGEEPVYRNYVVTRERQLKLYGTINVCNSARKSWESVIMKTGHTNGIVIKILNKYDSTL
jgi:hypothetical protein